MRALMVLVLVALVAGCSGAVAQAPPADDGLDLAVVRSVAGSPPRAELLMIDADGRTRGRVLQSPEGVDRAGGLSWAPDGRLLLVGAVGEQVFPRYRAGRGDLFAVAPDGGEARRLTETGDIAGAAMSPDGTTLALARRTLAPRFEQNSSGLWLMGADGAGLRPLLPQRPGRQDLPGAWSPDGRQLAFTRALPPSLGPRGRLTPRSTVWVVNADGTGARRIAKGRSPSWAPDGTRIAFVSTRDRNGEICGGDTCNPAAELYTVAADGSDLRRITRTTADEGTPAWSADGRWLAVEREEPDGPRFSVAIWILRSDGSCVRPLVRDASGVVSYRSPAWRPGAVVERDCAEPARLASVPDIPQAGLRAARAFRGHPLYWLGPVWNGRHLLRIDRSPHSRHGRYFTYGDCRTTGGECNEVQYQVADVCTAPPPNVRGPLPGLEVTRTRIRGVPAFDLGFQWEIFTGRVLIRVYATGRDARRVIAGLRGLNGPAKGLRPGQRFPPPIPGALERQLPCP